MLVPKGRLALSVYTAIEQCSAANALAKALDRHLGSGASAMKRSEHALADADELDRLVAAEGFRDVIVHTTTQTIRFPSESEYERIQLAATPMARMLLGMESGQRDALVER